MLTTKTVQQKLNIKKNHLGFLSSTVINTDSIGEDILDMKLFQFLNLNVKRTFISC